MNQRQVTRYDAANRPIPTRRLRDFPLALGGSSRSNQFFLMTTDWLTPGFRVERWQRADAAGAIVLRLDTVFPRGHDGRLATIFPFAASAEGRLAIADDASYGIRLHDPSGAQREIRRELARPEKSSLEIQREVELMRQQSARLRRMRQAEGGSPPSPRDFRPFPYRPHVARLDFDATGRLWVLTGRGEGRAIDFRCV
ncbi:MAG: hypothetical protein ACRENP_23950 [Longimicrobiales bacterium]